MSEADSNAIDVKTAVRIAKDYVREVFSGDRVENIGLEEVKLDEHPDIWKITIGFSRPWDESKYSYLMADMPNQKGLIPRPHRDYKIISISADTGKVIDIAIREVGI